MDKIKNIIEKIVFFLILILVWECIHFIFVVWLQLWKPYTFPSFFQVVETLGHLMKNNVLFIAIVASLKRVLFGYGLSIILGGILGLVMVQFKYLAKHLSSLILGFQTLPSVCWLPFAILWFGLNENAIIFVIAIGSVFAISLAVQAGILSINPLYIKAGWTLGASGWKKFVYIIAPASFPAILSGLKQGWSFAWRALMAGEMLSATKGLGQILMVGRDLGDISQVMAVMLVIVVIGLIVDRFVFYQLERRLHEKWGLDQI